MFALASASNQQRFASVTMWEIFAVVNGVQLINAANHHGSQCHELTICQGHQLLNLTNVHQDKKTV